VSLDEMGKGTELPAAKGGLMNSFFECKIFGEREVDGKHNILESCGFSTDI
jgi:hypothetical protein